MSRDALERRLVKHAATARAEPTLLEKKISPHVLRHTAAMRLLTAGVDSTVIALWLGHESVATTQIYTPTLLSRNRPSPAPRRWTPHRAATAHPTPS
ncbi:tyrosine-type recombinase/integrase [Streptomyces sp. ADMS]|uniref:tyrosine-type recombinase/integrase n=1 Tax=Streptomyces sp. ADMS TaxID=3071415 RepID=UPI0039957148